MQKKSFQIYNKSTRCRKTSERILVTRKEKTPEKSFAICNKSVRKISKKSWPETQTKNLAIIWISKKSWPHNLLIWQLNLHGRIHQSRQVGHDLQKILATQSLKNLLIWQLNLHGRIHQSREVGHDLQNMLATQGLENLLIWQLNLHRRIHQS